VNSYDDDDNDGFGPFSDSAGGVMATGGSDPFRFPSSSFSSYSDESFDFGDFQSASGGDVDDDVDGPPKDGELTPTGGSWTFTSSSDETEGDSEGDDFGARRANRNRSGSGSNRSGYKNGGGLRTISLEEVNERFEKKKQAWDS